MGSKAHVARLEEKIESYEAEVEVYKNDVFVLTQLYLDNSRAYNLALQAANKDVELLMNRLIALEQRVGELDGKRYEEVGREGNQESEVATEASTTTD